jgi:type VII secretion protein EccB
VAGYPTARLLLSGHRFLRRRLERAVVLGDAAADGDPIRQQSVSLTLGVALAVFTMGGCAMFGWLRPTPGLGDSLILMDRASGALYVRVGDAVHPVPNLASARLITGASEDPRQVATADLASAKRGPLLGIPGAPGVIGPALSPQESSWTVCDGAAATTVIVGPAANAEATRGLARDRPVLVSSRSNSTYLLYDGSRAVVDLTDSATVRALHLEGRTPRPVSPGLLSIIPELPPITAPGIPGFGSPGPQSLSGFMVGDVIRIERASTTEYFVVLEGGVQRIGAVAADLIRFAAARPGAEITPVAPAAIADIPVLGALPVAEFPDQIDAPLADDVSVLCSSWAKGKVTIAAGAGLPLSNRQVPIPLAQADGEGPAVDAVFVPPGRSAYVASTGTAAATGQLVTDTGVRYPIADTDAAHTLGLPDHPEPGPWPLLMMLPEGPEISRAAALLARDVLAAPPRASR